MIDTDFHSVDFFFRSTDQLFFFARKNVHKPEKKFVKIKKKIKNNKEFTLI